MPPKKRSRTNQKRSQQIGAAFENRIASLLQRQGYGSTVQTNVLLRDRHNNLSEIDVTYGRWPFKRYVECKAYRRDRPVPLSDVAKFKEVLLLNNISVRHGVVITTSTFSPRCQHTGKEGRRLYICKSFVVDYQNKMYQWTSFFLVPQFLMKHNCIKPFFVLALPSQYLLLLSSYINLTFFFLPFFLREHRVTTY